ncbi:GNAT family N-acetyltransferase [Caldiplasma sukawensis]
MERPIIKAGKNVSLGLIERSDAEFFYTTLNNPDVNRNLTSFMHAYTLIGEYEWIDNNSIVGDKQINFAVIENSSKRICGVAGLSNMDNRQVGTAGYFLSKNSWGKGYGTEALKLLLDYGFMTLNLRKIIAYVYQTNPASYRVMEKNGMKLVGRLREQCFIPEHGYSDELIYEILRSEYVKLS